MTDELFEQRVAPLELTFPLLPVAGMRLDLSEREIQLLLLSALNGIAANAATQAASVQRTPSISTVNANGTVAAGARALEFVFSPDFIGTVLGAVFNGANDASVPIPVPPGDTIGAVAYTITSGSARIIKVL